MVNFSPNNPNNWSSQFKTSLCVHGSSRLEGSTKSSKVLLSIFEGTPRKLVQRFRI